MIFNVQPKIPRISKIISEFSFFEEIIDIQRKVRQFHPTVDNFSEKS